VDIDSLLLQLYNEPDIEIRRYIPDKLAKIGDWRSTKPLGELILQLEQPEILRNEAVESLGKQGDPDAVKYLIQILADPNDEIRRTAVWSLGQIATFPCIQPIFSMKSDPNFMVKKWVIKSLARILHPSVPKLLDELFQHYYDNFELITEIYRANTRLLNFMTIELREILIKKAQTDIVNSQSKILTQAIGIFLNSSYELGYQPSDQFISHYSNIIDPKDTLVFPQYLLTLGYAKQVKRLKNNYPHKYAILGLGITGEFDFLTEKLNDTEDKKTISAILETLAIWKKCIPIDSYMNDSDLDIQLQALHISLKCKNNFDDLQRWYKVGRGLNFVIQLMKYYPEQSIQILEKEVKSGIKSARQVALYTLTSETFISNRYLHPKLIEIFNFVAKHDKIWHIRRDARFSLKLIQ